MAETRWSAKPRDDAARPVDCAPSGSPCRFGNRRFRRFDGLLIGRPALVLMIAMEQDPRADRNRPIESMSAEELEDFLTEAIGLYAEETRTPIDALRTFAEARLLLKNSGLVLALGNAEFRISITKTR